MSRRDAPIKNENKPRRSEEYEERPEKALVFFVSSRLIFRMSLCGNKVLLTCECKNSIIVRSLRRRVSHGADFDN